MTRFLRRAILAASLVLSLAAAPAISETGIHLREGEADEHGCRSLEVWNDDERVTVIPAVYSPSTDPICARNVKSAILPNGILLFDWDYPIPQWPPGAIAVWASDGTVDGTVRLATYGARHCLGDWEVIGKVGFVQELCGDQVWTITALGGTVATTFRLRSSVSAVPPHGLPFYHRLGDRIVYPGWTPEKGRELWISDGTRAGTRLLRDIRPGRMGSAPRGLLPRRGGTRIRFTAHDGTRRAWWVTDGTREGTRRLDVPCCPGGAAATSATSAPGSRTEGR